MSAAMVAGTLGGAAVGKHGLSVAQLVLHEAGRKGSPDLCRRSLHGDAEVINAEGPGATTRIEEGASHRRDGTGGRTELLAN